MNNHNLKPRSTPENGSPFICRLIPFVCLKYPLNHPLVCQNLPSVRNSGVTLIELIIVLTIAGILTALAVPGMQSFVSSNRLSSQVNELLADISLARSEAIKRNTTSGVCVTAVDGNTCVASGNWANGWLVYYCPTSDLTGCAAADRVVMKIHEKLTGNNTLTAPGDQLLFSKSGVLASGSGGQFTLTDPKTNTKRIVCVSATGRRSLSTVNCT